MKKENINTLVFAAMMIALTAVLFLVCKYMPLFSVFSTFVCGIPMAVFAAKNGLKSVVPTLIAIFAISVIIDGNVISALSMLFMSVIPGFAAGYMQGRKKTFFESLFAVCFAVCIGWVFELLMIEVFAASGIEALLDQVMSEMKVATNSLVDKMDSSLTENMKVSPEQAMNMILDAMKFTMQLYFPSLIVISSMITGYIIIRVSGFVLNRARILDTKAMPFSHLKAPRSMSTVAIICYLFYIFWNQESNFWPVLANVVTILYTIIGICGLSVVDFKLKAKVKTGVLRFFIYLAVFLFGGALMGIISSVLVIIGIMDVNRDFRMIEKSREDAR